MRIYDVIETNDQLDEGIASTIGQGLGAVGRGIGAVASVPQGIGRAVKRGYQAGLDTISGDAPGTAAAQAGGAVPTTGGAGGTTYLTAGAQQRGMTGGVPQNSGGRFQMNQNQYAVKAFAAVEVRYRSKVGFCWNSAFKREF